MAERSPDRLLQPNRNRGVTFLRDSRLRCRQHSAPPERPYVGPMRPSSSRAPRPTRAGAASSADCWERLPSRSRGAARRRDHEDRRETPGDSPYQRGFDGRVTEYASGTSRLPAAAHTESTGQRISGGRSNSITKTSRPSSASATSKVLYVSALAAPYGHRRGGLWLCAARTAAPARRATAHPSLGAGVRPRDLQRAAVCQPPEIHAVDAGSRAAFHSTANLTESSRPE